MSKKIEMLNEKAKEIRKLTVKTIGGLGVGHIGGAVSICEVLAALYFDVMNVDPENPKMENRDRFVLSKGHAGPAVYATYYRAARAVEIYTTASAQVLKKTVEEEQITYILFEEGMKFEEKECREDVIADTYLLVALHPPG